MTAQPHRFTTPLEHDYAESLAAFTNAELLDELEGAAYDVGARNAAGVSTERVRACRREIARRLASRSIREIVADDIASTTFGRENVA